MKTLRNWPQDPARRVRLRVEDDRVKVTGLPDFFDDCPAGRSLDDLIAVDPAANDCLTLLRHVLNLHGVPFDIEAARLSMLSHPRLEDGIAVA